MRPDVVAFAVGQAVWYHSISRQVRARVIGVRPVRAGFEWCRTPGAVITGERAVYLLLATGGVAGSRIHAERYSSLTRSG
jgi:hypothetical protein